MRVPFKLPFSAFIFPTFLLLPKMCFNHITGAPCIGMKASQTSPTRCCNSDDLPPERLFFIRSCSGPFCAVSLLVNCSF